MRNIFFCSDHHFNHANILKFENGRLGDFDDVEEMNEKLVENHNKVVTSKDKVFMLGDICWNVDAMKYVRRMNGYKVLIMGNHDKQHIKSYYGTFQDCKGVLYFNHDDIRAVLTHFPVHPNQLEYRLTHNFHGHGHRNSVDDPRYVNMCMEVLDYTPINIEEVAKRIKDGTMK